MPSDEHTDEVRPAMELSLEQPIGSAGMWEDYRPAVEAPAAALRDLARRAEPGVRTEVQHKDAADTKARTPASAAERILGA